MDEFTHDRRVRIALVVMKTRSAGQFLAVWAATATGLMGCARYQPMPLEEAGVQAALTVEIKELAKSRHSNAAGGRLHDVAVDLHDGLSPNEAAAVAVLFNPALRTERDRLAIGSAQLVQAGILPNPQLSLDVEPVIGGNTADTTTGYGVGLSWEITALIARNAKVEAGSSKASAIRLDVAWKEWQAAETARLAVFDCIALQESLEQARDVAARLSENLGSIQRAVDEGQQTIIELGAAETASNDAHAALLSTRRELIRQQGMLNRAIGFSADQDIPVQAGLRLPSRLELPPASEFLEGLSERRLDLVALRRGYASQESTLRAAVLSQFPKVGLGFTPASDTSNVHSMIIGVTVDIPIFDRNQGNIAIEKATRQQLYDEYVDRVFTARADIIGAIRDIEALGEEIAAAESAVPNLERLEKAYRLAIEAHDADVLSYYTVRNDLAQKRIDIVKLKQQLIQSGIALELASGIYLPSLTAVSAATQPATKASR